MTHCKNRALNITQRRKLLVLDHAQSAWMFPDMRGYHAERAREIIYMSPRDLYIFWQMLDECDLIDWDLMRYL